MERVVRGVGSPAARRWAAMQLGTVSSLLQQPNVVPAACCCTQQHAVASGDLVGSCNVCRGCNGAAAPQPFPCSVAGPPATTRRSLHRSLHGRALASGVAQGGTSGRHVAAVQQRGYWYDTLPSAALPWISPGPGSTARREAPLPQPPVAAVQQRAAGSSKPAQQQAAAEHVSAPRSFHVGGADKVSIKAQVVFDTCWRKLEDSLQAAGKAPDEVVWLNGAPGSGKGANTPFICESRGISRAITMSSLLDSSEEIRAIKDRGELVPDTLVGDALLNTVFDPAVADGGGILIDGFPRTAMQVDFLKLLYDKLLELHLKHADTPEERYYPRPSFKVVVLYVDQQESVKRQMARAQLQALHNTRALDAGTEDQVRELRQTDVDESKCAARYTVFKEHYGTLLRLKQHFPFSLIDAMGALDDCRRQIQRELRYQSSMDLDEHTYAAIRHLPLAKDLVRLARQQLVHRLDSYMSRKNEPVFRRVLALIDEEVVPLLRKCSLAGHAEFKTRDAVFTDNELAPDMLLDVLSDRGFSGSHVINERIIPAKVDPDTWEIVNHTDFIHKFRITFEKQGVREVSAAAVASPMASPVDAAIGHTYLPSHLACEAEHVALKGPLAEAAAAASQPQPMAMTPGGIIVERSPDAVDREAVPEVAPRGPDKYELPQQRLQQA